MTSDERNRSGSLAGKAARGGWAAFGFAVLFEIVFALAAGRSHGFTEPVPTVSIALATIGGTWCLSLALKYLPVGLTYAMWTGASSIGVVLASSVLGGRWPTGLQIFCFALITGGIVGLKLSSVDR